MHSVENVLQILIFFKSFPGLAIYGMIFCHDAGKWKLVTASHQLHDHKGKQLVHL